MRASAAGDVQSGGATTDEATDRQPRILSQLAVQRQLPAQSFGPQLVLRPSARDFSNGLAARSSRERRARASETTGTGAICGRHVRLRRDRRRRADRARCDGLASLELIAAASETISVVAPDSDGWTTVRNARGQSGLVPTSYIEIRAASSHSAAPTPLAPRTAPSRSQHVYYAFEASAADELSVQPGDQVTPTNRPAGEGWIEVQLGARTGLVPAWALDAPS